MTAPNRPLLTFRNIPVRDYAIEFAVSAVSFWFVAWILPSITTRDWQTAVIAAAIVSVLNALVWPIVARFFSRLILWTAGLLGLVANGLILLLAESMLDGLEIEPWYASIWAAMLMTFVGIAVSSILSFDDEAVFRRQTMKRMVGKIGDPITTDEPGILFLQIDGLAEPVLHRAIAEGHAPTLAGWIDNGSHRVIGWECDLSSQTGASQAGILHGNNENMPAFRWYDKDLGKVLTSNRPRDAATIEKRQSDGHGLLAEGGASRSNVFSGDSTDSVLTFSTVLDRSRASRHTANYVFSDPYAISRLLALTLADASREIVDRRRTRRAKIEPNLARGGIYPLLRAATTTILRDLTLSTLMSDVYRGVPVAYADFVGYDEVAHHSGIFAPTALDTLKRLDKQLARLEHAIADAPRPYHVVVLSDHGQSQGATFLQRYGHTLEDVVQSLTVGHTDIAVPEMASEGWGNLNGALNEAVRDEDSRIGKLLRVATRNRVVDGDVVLGPAYQSESSPERERDADIVVLASGNLGLISFTDVTERADLETIGTMHPGLIKGLAEHPGVGFVMVRSQELGPVVIGGAGIRYLSDDRVEGIDPLAVFGPNTADHLRRTDAFTNAPDILVNSFYDPLTGEGAAFEELIGFHGGLGGTQSEPFLLYPSTFDDPTEPIVGAATVHHLFKRWMLEMRAPDAPAPWSVPAESGGLQV